MCQRRLKTYIQFSLQSEEMDKNWLREDNLVAKGQVEVLVLEKKVNTL